MVGTIGMINFTMLIVILPLIAGLILTVLPKKNEKAIEWTSLIFSLLIFIISLQIFLGFDEANPNYQYTFSFPWIPQWGINFSLGIDGISLLLIILTTFLMPIVILSSWKHIHKLTREYYILLFILETAMIGTFAATNLFVFFIFWEMMLIPMFLIIGIWGSDERIYATVKFILYTAFGSFMMLAAIIYLYTHVGTLEFQDLGTIRLDPTTQLYLFLAFALAFAIKVPMFPFHTWLPAAHVEAPTAGSVILAGVLLKMGTYGFIRLAIPLFPDAVMQCMPYLIALSVVAIIYGALVCLVQTDIKKLIAYSSISHLGYVMLGLLVLNQYGVEGSVLQMVNHGISSAGLFLLVGILYQRYHTREIASYSGMAQVMPKYATIFMIIALSSIGLPVTNGFVGEFLVLVGAFQYSRDFYEVSRNILTFLPAIFASLGMVLSALYMLSLVEKVFFGKVHEKIARGHIPHKDLTHRELLYFLPLIVLIFWIGVYPHYFLNKASGTIALLIATFK